MPPGVSLALGGLQVATKAALRPLLGGSWRALGAVLGSLGPLPGPPGPLLGVILASRGSLFRGFGEVYLMLGPGPFQITFFDGFNCVFVCCLVLFLIPSCLSRGDPGGYANIEKS